MKNRFARIFQFCSAHGPKPARGLLASIIRRSAPLAAALCLLASAGWTQNLTNYTNFPMIGLVRGQTLQINVEAYPPEPCFAQLGFQDANGNPLGTTLSVSLQAGQSASLTLNGNSLTNAIGQRVEVQPVVTAPSGGCIASAEVWVNLLGATSVYIPPDPCSSGTGCVAP